MRDRNDQTWKQYPCDIRTYRRPWKEVFGDPDGLWFCHYCDEGLCWEPMHIYLGTPSDNAKDRWDRHSYVAQHGEPVKAEPFQPRPRVSTYPDIPPVDYQGLEALRKWEASVAVDSRILDLIGKLKAKEDSLRQIGGEMMLNEAAECAARISELCLRHKIEMTDVERAEHKEANPIGRMIYNYDGTEEYRARSKQAWEVTLVNAVARAHDCRALIGNGYLVFVGREPDVAVATQVFRILRKEITEACTYGYRQARKQGLRTRGFIASFFTAATHTIQRRYMEMREAVVEANMARAMVLASDREVNDFVDSLGLRTTKHAQRGSLDNHWGFAAGHKLGSEIPLGTNALEDGS